MAIQWSIEICGSDSGIILNEIDIVSPLKWDDVLLLAECIQRAVQLMQVGHPLRSRKSQSLQDMLKEFGIPQTPKLQPEQGPPAAPITAVNQNFTLRLDPTEGFIHYAGPGGIGLTASGCRDLAGRLKQAACELDEREVNRSRESEVEAVLGMGNPATPRAESREPRAESREPRAESNDRGA